jgi:hypothetical protein
LLVSSATIAACVVGFGLSQTFPAFLMSYSFWAVGLTFKSGTNSAWLSDVLDARGDADAFTRASSRAKAVRAAVTAVTSLGAGVLFEIDERLPFLVHGALAATGVLVGLTFPEAAEQSDESPMLTIPEAVGIVRSDLSRPSLRGFVVHVTLLSTILSLTPVIVQPATIQAGTRLGLAPERVEQLLGPLYAVITATSAIGGYLAAPLKRRLGIRAWFVLVPPLLGLGLLSVHLVPIAIVPLVTITRTVSVMTGPFTEQYLNDRIDSRARSTVLSTVSLWTTLVAVPMQLAAGVLTDRVGPLVLVAGLGGVLLLGTLLCQWRVPLAADGNQGTGTGQ